MGYIFDLVILLFFAMMVYKNLRKTQLRVITESVSFLGASVGAVPLARLAASFCYTTFFRQAMAKKLVTAVNEAAFIQSGHTGLDRMLELLPSTIRNASVPYQLHTDEISEQVDALLVGNVSQSPAAIADILVRPVITGIFSAAFYIIIFCGLLYLLTSFGASLENLMYTPDRGAYNTVLGGVLGAFKGIVILLMTITFIQLVLPAFPISIKDFSAEQLSSSFLFRLFYDQNALMLFLGKGIYPTILT